MEPQSWSSVYRLLAALGLPRPATSYEVTDGKGKLVQVLTLAWPETKVGLLVDEVPVKGLVKEGWRVVSVRARTLEQVAPLLADLDLLRVNHLLGSADNDAKMTVSKTERKMMMALERAGLMVKHTDPLLATAPDRNLEVRADDGSLLTVPDFAWETYRGRVVKVVLEVDGFYFHGGQDLRAEIMAAAGGDPEAAKTVNADARNKTSRDAAKRRVLAMRGWSVLVVSDAEVDLDDGPDRVAAQVRELLLKRWAEADPAAPPAPAPAHVLDAPAGLRPLEVTDELF